MNALRRRLGLLVPLLCLLGLAGGAYRALKTEPGRDLSGFGMLPVVANGRIQPIDSLARNALLAIHGKQRLSHASAVEWFAKLSFQPAEADKNPVFLIHHDEVLGLLEIKSEEGKSFSFERIVPHFGDLSQEAKRIALVDSQKWSPYEKALMRLWKNLGLYQQLKFALAHPGTKTIESDLKLLIDRAKEAELPGADPVKVEASEARKSVLKEWSPQTHVFACPPVREGSASEWEKLPDSVLRSIAKGTLHPSNLAYARMGDSWRADDTGKFNAAVSGYRDWLGKSHPGDLAKTRAELAFNLLAPFYACMVLYVVAFICVILSWLWTGGELRIAAHRVLLIALTVHTIGLIVRMCLEGRPPVTNLYSSAVFIGWGAVVLSSVLEWFHKNGIGTAVAAVTGFVTLVIAHHLSLSGDTLEMMRAVLDSNFWLATHVIVITLGYSATFLAGSIAIVYLLRHAFGGVPKSAAVSMKGMVYGTLCFALLASFVGTVLGGIWADQSWGRFWGWDPKENGALLIVIWNAIILHARWGGMIREKGMMVMAVFGNIVTSWSWFGTNMLGIGLHSYGFTDAAFLWLTIFIASQLLVMALGFIRRAEKPADRETVPSPDQETSNPKL